METDTVTFQLQPRLQPRTTMSSEITTYFHSNSITKVSNIPFVLYCYKVQTMRFTKEINQYLYCFPPFVQLQIYYTTMNTNAA